MWEGISWHLWNCHCCTLETCPSVPDPARAVSSFLPLRSRFAVPHAVHGKGAAGAIRYFIPGGWWHLRGPPSQLRMPRFRHADQWILPSDIYRHCSDSTEPPFLQAEQSQPFHPVLIGEVLQDLDDLGGPMLDPFQHIPAFHSSGSPHSHLTWLSDDVPLPKPLAGTSLPWRVAPW